MRDTGNGSNTQLGRWKNVPEQEKAREGEREWEMGLKKACQSVQAILGIKSIACRSKMEDSFSSREDIGHQQR